MKTAVISSDSLNKKIIPHHPKAAAHFYAVEKDFLSTDLAIPTLDLNSFSVPQKNLCTSAFLPIFTFSDPYPNLG